MTKNLTKALEDILNGKVSVEEAQKYLSQINDEDLKRLIPEDKLKVMLEKYKAINDYDPESMPRVSDEEKAGIWEKVVSSDQKPESAHTKFYQWLMETWANICDALQDTSFRKYGMAAAAISIILVLSPVIYHLSRQSQPNYIGFKGEDARRNLPSLQFAIADPKGKLERPDRPLTENDMLAFRTDASGTGYCSLYVIYNEHIDIVVLNKLLSEGTNDLDVGYSLTGNKGRNTLAMLFSDAPIDGKENRRLIFEAVRNNVSSMTILGNVIYMIYETVEIH